MSNLNLYNYYDKSLADINRDYLNAKKHKKAKKKDAPKSRKIFMVLFLVAAITVPIGVFLGKQLSDTALEVIHPKEAAKPDLRSTEEKLGYVKVQIFEFADDAPVSAKEAQAKQTQIKEEETEKIVAQKNKDDETNALIAARKEFIPSIGEPKKETEQKVVKEPKKENVEKKKVASKNESVKTVAPAATVAEKKYSILFEDIDSQQYGTVSSLASRYRIKSEIQDSINNSKIYWRVYRVNPNSTLIVGGKNVDIVKDFTNKDEAIAFAKEHNIQSVIKLEEEKNNIYTIRLCCSSLESAKEIAESSKIMNKTIKIIREK